MFNPNELEAIPLPLEEHFKDLEFRIMSDIIRRIQINSEVTRSADWQIYRSVQLGKSMDEITKFIKSSLKASDKEIDRLYNDVIKTGYARDESLYKEVGKPFIPFADNIALKQLINAVSEQTKEELKNITQSMGFAVEINGQTIFKPIAEYYQRTLDSAMLDITSGAFDYNTVLKRIVSEMTTSGMRTVDYATGWSNRIPVAARRAVMTGLGQVTGKINEDNAEQLETDLYEVTWHVGARPSHMVWQGRVFTKQQLIDVCGLGSGDGLCGWGCRHDYYPYIEGISERTYTDTELEEMNARENIPKAYNGKEYTSYTATQKQRKLETLMRKQRQDIKLLQEGGADEDEIMFARSRYRSSMAQYAEFSKKMDLPQQRERITVDGLGNIGVGKYKKTVGIKKNSGIIKEKEPSEVRKLLQENKIEYKEVQKLPKQLSDDEIIQRLGGGDETDGSCSSLAFAYIGNKAGLDVLDFRGGESRKFFSKNKNIASIASLDGVKSQIVKVKNEIRGSVDLLKDIEYDKHYYFAVGKHAAIVRRTEQFGFEYLELQSARNNGFKRLTTDGLRQRFRAQKSRTFLGQKYETDVVLIDGSSLKGNTEFEKILGYINTSENVQMKGAGGRAK